MHNRDVAHAALKGGQLLEDVLRVLASQAREFLQAVRVGPVTGAASGYTLRLDPVLVDFAPTCHKLDITTRRGGFRLLPGVIARERVDRGVVELARHAPHVTDGIGIAARLGAKRLELRGQVMCVLTRESGEFRVLTV